MIFFCVLRCIFGVIELVQLYHTEIGIKANSSLAFFIFQEMTKPFLDPLKKSIYKWAAVC